MTTYKDGLYWSEYHRNFYLIQGDTIYLACESGFELSEYCEFDLDFIDLTYLGEFH